MDIVRHLTYFLAVVDEGSFSRAAEALGMAQPPLSQRIKSLESHLGVELFDRSRRQIQTTAAGSLLVPEARTIVQAVGELASLVSSAHTHQDVEWLHLPTTLDLDDGTQVARRLAESMSVTVLPRLLPVSERGDDAYERHPRVVPGPGSWQVQVPLGLAVGPRHPVAREGLQPHPSDFSDSVLVLLDEDGWQRDVLLQWLASCGVDERLVVEEDPTTAAARGLLTDAGVVTDEHHARRNGLQWFGPLPVQRTWHVTGDHAAEVATALAAVLGGNDA